MCPDLTAHKTIYFPSWIHFDWITLDNPNHPDVVAVSKTVSESQFVLVYQAWVIKSGH